jgi:outer membrane protein OmpA-like peptidoglycan-associated protein
MRSATTRTPGAGIRFLVLLGSVVFLVAGTAVAVRLVERDLTDKAVAALDNAGIDIQVSYRGRDAELTGIPADSQEATEAVLLVTAIHGTRRVRTGWAATSDGTTTADPTNGDSPDPTAPGTENTQSAYPPLPQGRVSFGSGDTFLDDEDTMYLDQVVVFLRDNPTVQLQVQGHADDTGAEDTNLDLSWSRAQEVVRYLIVQGISSNRLSAQGLGSTVPLISNDTPEGRAANRRVELTIEEPS